MNQESSLQSQNELYLSLISALSHDVVGPLRWVISLLDALVQDESISPEKVREYTDTALSSLKNSLGTMDSLLKFSREAVGRGIDELEEFELSPLLNQKQEVFGLAYDYIDINISSDIHLRVKTNKVILNIALENILANAVKYSSKGCDIDVSTHKTDTSILIRIQNYCAPISTELLQDLNQGKIITQDTRVSIGLFIANKLLTGVGAKLHFAYQESDGMVVSIEIPTL